MKKDGVIIDDLTMFINAIKKGQITQKENPRKETPDDKRKR